MFAGDGLLACLLTLGEIRFSPLRDGGGYDRILVAKEIDPHQVFHDTKWPLLKGAYSTP